ncbi:MAG TPA: hypothetical protein PLO23_03535 [Alphaproteobacteria bacterium]|nr:hypothetical protein [Alphaproteobacteria bacterium]
MFDLILQSFQIYYGLDWVALAAGVSGTWFLTQRNPLGFVLSGVACFCGLMIAALSMQYGFIVYNVILLTLMAKGFAEWRLIPVQNSP